MRTDKSKFSSPSPDFYACKHECAIVAKDNRDAATSDFVGLFL